MSYCDRCGNFVMASFVKCECKPFEAQRNWGPKPWETPPEDGNWHGLHARDAEEAAERFAETYDAEGDYPFLSARHGRVWVRDPDGTVTRWEIEAEAEPVYTATEYSSENGEEKL